MCTVEKDQFLKLAMGARHCRRNRGRPDEEDGADFTSGSLESAGCRWRWRLVSLEMAEESISKLWVRERQELSTYLAR